MEAPEPVKEDMPARYKAGDKINYPGMGVAEIVEVQERDLGGCGKAALYLIKFCATDRKILVPVGNVEKIGIRPLISEADALRVMTILKEKSISGQVKSLRANDYRRLTKSLGSSSITELAELVGELSYLKYNRSLSFTGRQILGTALTFLAGEIAEVTGRAEEEVSQEIKEIFN